MSDLSATAVATAATETTDVVSTATEAVTPPPEPVAPPTQPSAPEPPAPEPQASAPTPGDSDSGIVDTVTQAADPDPVDPAPASEPEVVPDVHTVASTPDVSDTAAPSDVGATLTDAVSGAGSDGLVKASLEQQVAALTGSRVPAASLGGANGAAETEGVGDTAASDEARGGVRGTIESFVSPLREGFDQATRDAGEATDGFSDSRLLVQVGMALGVVYLAFLSLWFWLTRVRWSSRAQARGA